MFLWTIEMISALLKVVGKDQAGLSLEDINSLSAHCFLKFLKKTQAISLYWFAVQQQSNTSRRQKFDVFIQNIVQSLMNSGSGQKMSKTKTVRKTTYIWHSGPKG